MVTLRTKLILMKDIKISIRDLRAVKSADIELNGITVLSGVNSSGKSTISRLLYYAIKYANDYASVVRLQFSLPIKSIVAVAEVLDGELRNYFPDQLDGYFPEYRLAGSAKERENSLIRTLITYKEILEKVSQDDKNSLYISRISTIIKNDVLHKETDKSITDLMADLIAKTQKLFEAEEQMIAQREHFPYLTFVENKMHTQMRDVTLSEYGMPFLGYGKVEHVPILSTIRRVAYIDTPMLVGTQSTQPFVEYWNELSKLLQHPSAFHNNSELVAKISEKIGGAGSYDMSSMKNPLRFKRDDGESFNLFESATGIKSFSILQILLNNGFIDKNTLLIIDEPEAHLHPQWIVEYARMIVLIHKQIGTKFFIASHSTDFVSAIKYIATKEGCLETLSYYLSEEYSEKRYSYNYRSLGQDIEPIFESFNKSFELIDKYGTDND